MPICAFHLITWPFIGNSWNVVIYNHFYSGKKVSFSCSSFTRKQIVIEMTMTWNEYNTISNVDDPEIRWKWECRKHKMLTTCWLLILLIHWICWSMFSLDNNFRIIRSLVNSGQTAKKPEDHNSSFIVLQLIFYQCASNGDSAFCIRQMSVSSVHYFRRPKYFPSKA